MGRQQTFAYAFEGPVEILDYGRMKYTVIRLPASLARRAPFAGKAKLRMVGRIGDARVRLAWLVDTKGRYCIVGRTLLRAAKLAVGERVHVAFDLVADDVVHVPAEIREALRQEHAWRKSWTALTPGKQRGVAYMVDKLKDPEVRAQRAIDVLRAVAAGNVPGPPPRRRAQG